MVEAFIYLVGCKFFLNSVYLDEETPFLTTYSGSDTE